MELHDVFVDAIIVGNIVDYKDRQSHTPPWLIVVDKGEAVSTVERTGYVRLDDQVLGLKRRARLRDRPAGT